MANPATRSIAAVVLAVAMVPAFAQDAGDATLEYQIKATFLYTVAKFVDWPAAKSDPTAPLRVGVYGKDPFGPLLERAFQGKTVNGRPLVIERLKSLDQAGHYHILFISSGEKKRLDRILGSLTDEGVMTISDMANFAEQGGVVNLVMRANAVSMEINVSAAEKAHLKISSRLLSLARVVR